MTVSPLQCFKLAILSVFGSLLSMPNTSSHYLMFCRASDILNHSAVLLRIYGLMPWCTFDARVSSHQIQLEVLRARRRAVEQLVWDGDAARSATGTATVGERSHVRVAPDVAVVAPDTAAILHPAVVGAGDDDYLVRLTGDLQLIPLTVLGQPCSSHARRSYDSFQTK